MDLQDEQTGVVAQIADDSIWVATHTSLSKSKDTALYLKSPYIGRLGPESLKLLQSWIVSTSDDLFTSDMQSCSESADPFAVDSSIVLQLRMFRAVC